MIQKVKDFLKRHRCRCKIAVAVTFFLFLVLTVLFCLAAIYLRGFMAASQLSWKQVKQKVVTGWQTRKNYLSTPTNLLLLGLDQRHDRLENTMLVDTIILASLNPQTSKLTLIPIPRDLWIDPLKTKINAIYYYGEINESSNGPDFLIDQLTQITGQSIDYWLLMNYEDLVELVNVLGPLEVHLDQGLEDNQYPNPAHVEGEEDQPLYTTVRFPQGTNFLDGNLALQFVRSRKSTNLEQGNDLARSARQMKLFKALITRIKSRQVILNSQRLGKLYQLWREKVKTNLKDENLVALVFAILPKRDLQLTSVGIPASYEGEETILINPPLDKYGQWVWEPRAGDWSELQDFIERAIK